MFWKVVYDVYEISEKCDTIIFMGCRECATFSAWDCCSEAQHENKF